MSFKKYFLYKKFATSEIFVIELTVRILLKQGFWKLKQGLKFKDQMCN